MFRESSKSLSSGGQDRGVLLDTLDAKPLHNMLQNSFVLTVNISVAIYVNTFFQKISNTVQSCLLISPAPSRYSDLLRDVRSGDRIPVGARFSAPVQTGHGAHPASCAMGTGYFPGVKSDRGLTLIPHPLLVPWSRKCRVIPLFPLWAVRPV